MVFESISSTDLKSECYVLCCGVRISLVLITDKGYSFTINDGGKIKPEHDCIQPQHEIISNDRQGQKIVPAVSKVSGLNVQPVLTITYCFISGLLFEDR